MEGDDRKRGSNGVVCSLREIGNGRLRVALDDVKNESGSVQGAWKHYILLTWKDYEIDRIVDLKLSEKEWLNSTLMSL